MAKLGEIQKNKGAESIRGGQGYLRTALMIVRGEDIVHHQLS